MPNAQHITLRLYVISATWLTAILVVFLSSYALAETKTREAQSTTRDSSTACFKRSNQERTVVQIVDPETVRLEDNSEVRFADILLPRQWDINASPQEWPPQQNALQALSRLVNDKRIYLEDIKTQTAKDRYGRRHAHIIVAKGQEQEFWLQAALVSKGYARVNPTSKNIECQRVLLALEAKARREQKGLWANAAYKISASHKTRRLLKDVGTFKLVHGRVQDVANKSGRIYLNFGKNWRTDFTVQITKKKALDHSQVWKSTIDNKLVGARVLVRGWVESKNGPLISIEHPLQLYVFPR